MQSSTTTARQQKPKADVTEITKYGNYLTLKIMTTNSFRKATEIFVIIGAKG